MFARGDRVRFVRALPGDSHCVYLVTSVTIDEEGVWVSLFDEQDQESWASHNSQELELVA